MKYCLKYLKNTAFLFSMIVLFQSCAIIYKSKPSTIEQVSARKNTHIKVITRDGYKHKLKWIEERNGHVYSIYNTKRVYVDEDKIGSMQTKHKLINIEDKGDYIRGLKTVGKDTTTIIIPIDEIEKIRMTNRGISYPLNIIGWGVFTIAAGYGLFVALWSLGGSV